MSTAPITLTTLTTTTAETSGTGHDRRHAPASVIAGRVVLALHGLALVGLGVLVLGEPRIPALIGILSVVEGVVRLALAAALREDARRTRATAVVLAAIGVGVAAMNLPWGLIGVAVNVVIVRCLSTEAAKEHFDTWA